MWRRWNKKRRMKRKKRGQGEEFSFWLVALVNRLSHFRAVDSPGNTCNVNKSQSRTCNPIPLFQGSKKAGSSFFFTNPLADCSPTPEA